MTAKRSPAAAPTRVVIVTLDAHLAGAAERTAARLAAQSEPIVVTMHVAADWMRDSSAIARCRQDIATADLILVTQLFMEAQVDAIHDALAARVPHCDAVMVAMCAPALMRFTRMGSFTMAGGSDASPWSPASLMRRLLGGKRTSSSAGERQMATLRRVPKLLRYIPGTAQDVRAYYVMLLYWLAASEENLSNLVRYFVGRYARTGASRHREGNVVSPPVVYPEVGLYHPDVPGGIAESLEALPMRDGPRVGLLVMRSYVLAGNTAHYDAVIRALEARGLVPLPAFASTLDNRPAVRRFFQTEAGVPTVDALISLTGFSLVGGPAYSDAAAARDVLAALDVPYIVAQPLEFQSIDEWRADDRGLNALQATLQVAIPELEGATNPTVFAGKSSQAAGTKQGETVPIAERVDRLAERAARLVALRRKSRAEKRIAVVLFGFPPNVGNVGSAAYLDVFASLAHTLRAMRDAGYTVDAPNDVEALRRRIVEGNAERNGTIANVHTRVSANEHVRREPWLVDIERAWGVAPGRQLTDGASLFILGERFGNVFVGVQPAFGYEGDPMRLLFEKGFAPTHAFSAFYRWLCEDFAADAIVHFGTHGALEFMPGKQTGLDAACWPDRLLGDTPNIYLYALNNPSEGTLAKRRGAATLVSYLTPPVMNAGLYRGLLELKATIDRLRATDLTRAGDADAQIALVQRQAVELSLLADERAWDGLDTRQALARVDELRARLLELEYALIPDGLHAIGRVPSIDQRIAILAAMAREPRPDLGLPSLGDLIDDATDDAARARVREWVVERSIVVPERGAALVAHLRRIDERLSVDSETPALLRALDGRHIQPAPGGDVLRNPDVLPAGRNVYGFDPYRVPSANAMREGRAQAERLIARHRAEHGAAPSSIAMVLWGTDNMKTEGNAIGLALALMGAEPRFDGLGRLCGARLVPLSELRRGRIDVAITLSGVFRDLFPLQIELLAEAALLCAQADEPLDENAIRLNTLAHQRALGCDVETAALRVFSNAEGAYGANVNLLVDAGTWQAPSELGDAFSKRKSFAYGRAAKAAASPNLFARVLRGAELAYQTLDSVELGATDVDQYFDSLGGLSRAVEAQRGRAVPAYMGDTTTAAGTVRTLDEQIAFESRTRLLNPRWYEGMLRSGYEGVRAISTRVTNTVGWSATTSAVPAWVYRDVTTTFVTDTAMRERLSALNPHATLQLTSRLLEAHDRGYWQPDEETLNELRAASAELEDRIEGVYA